MSYFIGFKLNDFKETDKIKEYYETKEYVVNIKNTRRYLRTELAFGVCNNKGKSIIEDNINKIDDIMIRYLSNVELETIINSKEKIKEDIKNEINKELEEEVILEVFFNTFVWQ